MGTREPLWCVVLVGWVATTWIGGFRRDEAPLPAARSPDAQTPDAQTLEPPDADSGRVLPDPERASTRELRKLPGIGETRALEIVRDRWARKASGAPLEWGNIRGVGPLTERRIRDALEEQDVPPGPPAGPGEPASRPQGPGGW